MGQNPRRPGFRLRWGEGERSDAAESTANVVDAAAEQDAPVPERDAPVPEQDAPANEAASTGVAAGPDTETEVPAAAASPEPPETPFLRDLVGAMRGVAESSRDSSLEGVRQAVEQRVAELTAGAAERAEELRRRADLDINGIGDWERTELERVRREAGQRREARQKQLEQQLADHQAATDREVDATRGRLADHERELATFFAQLSEITDPAAFVAAAKRMPPRPDLTRPAGTVPAAGAAADSEGAAAEQQSATNGSAASTAPSDETLAQRLAQLDRRLAQNAAPAGAAPPAATTPQAAEVPAAQAEAAPAPAAPASAPPEPSSGGAATAVETSTAIVVKGLGSFGAITSFKQALERVEGVHGVTLSLGPTGDFVYRASHAADFDILGAIRSIEGPNAGIEQSDGSLVVTVAGPR